MQVNLHLKNVKDTPAFQGLILKRIASSLDKFSNLIRAVDVHIEDEKEEPAEEPDEKEEFEECLAICKRSKNVCIGICEKQ